MLIRQQIFCGKPWFVPSAKLVKIKVFFFADISDDKPLHKPLNNLIFFNSGFDRFGIAYNQKVLDSNS